MKEDPATEPTIIKTPIAVPYKLDGIVLLIIEKAHPYHTSENKVERNSDIIDTQKLIYIIKHVEMNMHAINAPALGITPFKKYLFPPFSDST